MMGTIPHSHTGKHNPSRPLARVASNPFFGSMPVMILDGMNAAIAPEIKEPTRTNGKPSKASAKNEYKKFCHVNVNQLITAYSDPIQLLGGRPDQLPSTENPAQGHGKDEECHVGENDGGTGWQIQLCRGKDSQRTRKQAKGTAQEKHLPKAG